MPNHPAVIIQTERLILRQWCDQDLEPFAIMNADPRVMEFFPSILSKKESDDLAKRIFNKITEQSWGLWAVSIPHVTVKLTHLVTEF